MTYRPVVPAEAATDPSPRHVDAQMRWLTRATAAGYAGVSMNTIDRWARDGRITRYRVEGMRSVRFKKDELDALFRPVSTDAA